MEAICRILNTVVFTIGEEAEITVMEIGIDELMANNPDILDDPAPLVIFEDFGDSALIFDAFFWIELTSQRTLRGVRSAMRFEITELFKKNGITIAFPQRDVHIAGSLKLEK